MFQMQSKKNAEVVEKGPQLLLVRWSQVAIINNLFGSNDYFKRIFVD